MPRADIHPEYHPVIFQDGDYELFTHSTMTSSETRTVDGVDHFVIKLDISSASHPFWTGQQRFVDSEGRVERFRAKYASRTGRKSGRDSADKKLRGAADKATDTESSDDDAE